MVRRICLAVLAAVTSGSPTGNLVMAQAPAAAKGSAEKHPSDQLATWIDARFEELWKASGVEQKEVVDDSTYLRRVYLDLVGTIPQRVKTWVPTADAKTDRLPASFSRTARRAAHAAAPPVARLAA